MTFLSHLWRQGSLLGQFESGVKEVNVLAGGDYLKHWERELELRLGYLDGGVFL